MTICKCIQNAPKSLNSFKLTAIEKMKCMQYAVVFDKYAFFDFFLLNLKIILKLIHINSVQIDKRHQHLNEILN